MKSKPGPKAGGGASQGALWAPETLKVPKKRELQGKEGLFALGSVSSGLSRSGKLPPIWGMQWVENWAGRFWGAPGKSASGLVNMPHPEGSRDCSMGRFGDKVWWGFGLSIGCVGTAGDRLDEDGGTVRPLPHCRWSTRASSWLPADLSKGFRSFSDERGNESPHSPCVVQGLCSAVAWLWLQRCRVWLIAARTSGLQLTARKIHLLGIPSLFPPAMSDGMPVKNRNGIDIIANEPLGYGTFSLPKCRGAAEGSRLWRATKGDCKPLGLCLDVGNATAGL